MRERARRLVVAVGLTACALAGPWGTALAADKFVTMYANEYRPGVVTINVGDTVTWVNDDDVPHDAVGNGWSTSMLTNGDSDAVTFRRRGSVRVPLLHPSADAQRRRRPRRGWRRHGPADGHHRQRPDDADPPTSWVTVALALVAGSGLLLAIVWPRRARSET